MSKRNIASFFQPVKKAKSATAEAAAAANTTTAATGEASPSPARIEQSRQQALAKLAAKAASLIPAASSTSAASSSASSSSAPPSAGTGAATGAATASSSFLPPIPAAWEAAVGAETRKPYFRALDGFLALEAARKRVYPPREEIFAALSSVAPQDVRVVILGQDPYHGAGQGHGLAFSVKKGIATPPSLR